MTGSGSLSDPRVAVLRARQLLREKRYADALQTCTDELARGANDPELRLIAAHSLYAQGRHEGAKKEALQVVRAEPKQAEAHRILANIAFSRGELSSVREHLGRILELEPEDEKSRSMLRSLDRASVVGGEASSRQPASASGSDDVLSGDAPSRPGAEGAKPGALSIESQRADRSDSAISLVLGDEDLEDEIEIEDAEAPGAEGSDSSGEGMAVSDSMLMDLSSQNQALIEGTPRGLPTEHDPTRSGPPQPPPGKATLPGPPPPGSPQPAGGIAPPAKPQAPIAMDTGAGQGVEPLPGTLRLPALDDLPEEDDAPTMPLLRPSAPPEPQLRLDPLGATPVSREPVGASRRPPSQAVAQVADKPASGGFGGRARPPSQTVAPVAGSRPGGALGPDVEEEDLEAASSPLAQLLEGGGGGFGQPPEQQTKPRPGRQPGVPAAALFANDDDSGFGDEDDEGSGEEVTIQRAAPPGPGKDRSPGGLLNIMAGELNRRDATLSQGGVAPPSGTAGAKAQERSKGKAKAKGRGKDKGARQPVSLQYDSGLSDPGFGGEVSDPGFGGEVSDPGFGGEPGRPLSDQSLERQLLAAADLPPLKGKIKKKRQGGHPFRWLLVAVLGLSLGGAGVIGYLWYQSYKFVQAEYVKLRQGVHLSTPEGYRQGRAAALRILEHRPGDPKAEAALSMIDAAMSLEFGDDKLQSAREHLQRSQGVDSEWRTAANAFLALMEDPARAEGYLLKGLEGYPKSALLHYLMGRALAARELPQKAGERYKQALALEPKFVAAHIAMAVLRGRQEGGYDEAVAALDSVLQAAPDNIQALIQRARLRARLQKEPGQAAADAARVTDELAAKAGRGQRGWAQLVQAQVARQTGKLVSAGEALDAAIKSPHCCDNSFRYTLAGELMALYRMADAREQLRAALELKPKLPDNLLRLAEVLLELDHPREAEPLLNQAPQRLPRTRFLAGWLAYAQGRYKQAEQQLAAVKGELEGELQPAIVLALAQARQGKTSEAAAALSQLAAKAPTPEVTKALGTVQLWGGDPAKADATLKQAWKLTKFDPAIPTRMGDVSYKQNELGRAESRYRRALVIIPSYRQALLGLARLDLKRGAPGQAEQQLSKISQADQGLPDVLALSARIALAQGKLDAAAVAIDQAQQAGAGKGLISWLQGELALAKGDGAAAEALLRQAGKLLPGTTPELLAALGQAQLLQRKVDDAYDTFHLVIKADPQQPQALLELGRIAVRDLEHAVAVKRYEQALAAIKARGMPEALAAEVHTALARAYLAKGDTGRSITNLQDAMRLAPAAAEPQYVMGLTYDKLEHQQAIVYYEKSLELDPSQAELHRLLGKAYAKHGQPEQAARHYQAYLQAGPPADKAREVQQALQQLGRGQ